MSTPAAPWTNYAASDSARPWEKYGATPGSVSSAALPPTPPSLFSQIAHGHQLEDVGKGMLEGIGSDVYNIGNATSRIPIVGKYLAPSPEAQTRLKNLITPATTSQKIGRGVEQAGEFLAPGLGEEAATADLAKAAPKLAPLGRIAYSGLTSGLVNKAQGGEFGTGAAAGAAAGAVGEGLKALAPSLAESAIGIRKLDRANGRQVGKAILNETRGFTPGAVAESANEKLGELNPQLVSTVQGAPQMVDLTPARNVVGGAINTATQRNAAKEAGQLQPIQDFLSREFNTGNAIPPQIPASRMLDLRRGLSNEFVHNWNPEVMPGVTGTARKAYGSLTGALHEAVPETVSIDQRISNLIPVAKRAESTALNAPIGQRVAHRLGAHTGALATGLMGGYSGYERGGLPGALIGGTAGLVLPELLASPTGEMLAARTANNAAPILRPLVGAGLQLDRDKKKKGNNE